MRPLAVAAENSGRDAWSLEFFTAQVDWKNGDRQRNSGDGVFCFQPVSVAEFRTLSPFFRHEGPR